MTKDRRQHHLISVLQAVARVRQADRDSAPQAAPADRVDHARDVLSSAVKFAVFVLKKT